MSKIRNHRSPEEKASLLRRHHIDKVPVTTICEEAGLQPSVFYHWQRELFERAAHVLGNGSTGRPISREQELEKKVSALAARLTKKDEVIAEISADEAEQLASDGDVADLPDSGGHVPGDGPAQ